MEANSTTESAQVTRIVHGESASDGAGVNLTRFIGTQTCPMVDPFLLLDMFESSTTADYIAGFPNHPHRGFETVTYLLAGRMRHRDNLGNEGVIEPGGVQWMTAGSGIVHSEFPEQRSGLLHGFQLWVNLPRNAKTVAPGYQERTEEQIPKTHLRDGTEIKAIAGITPNGIQGIVQNRFTHPL